MKSMMTMKTSTIIVTFVLMGGIATTTTKTTTAFTIFSTRAAAAGAGAASSSVVSPLEVEPCVIETRYPLSLSIPIPKNVDDEEDNNAVVEEEDEEDTIQCIHYPTMDGTLPAASNVDTVTPLSSSSSSLSSAPAPAPLMPIIADAAGDNNGVVETTRYPLSLSIPLPIDDAENEKDDASIPYPIVNGWTVDPSQFCAGLPGAVAPLGNFDPLDFMSKLPIQEIKRYREAETMHGRVAMLATVGYLVAEHYQFPYFQGHIGGPANTHLTQLREQFPSSFVGIMFTIATLEFVRSAIGWENPITAIEKNNALEREDRRKYGADYVGEQLWFTKLHDHYYPGDLRFDPLNLKPTDPKEFAIMQTKELQHGRLAMIAAVGMIVQEQITHATLF